MNADDNAIEFVARKLHDTECTAGIIDAQWDELPAQQQARHRRVAAAAVVGHLSWMRSEQQRKPRFSEGQEGGLLGQRVHVPPTCVLQHWVMELPLMQQTVLLTAIRGPDNTEKYTSAKYLLRWFRRCTLISAMDKRVLDSPVDEAGGSFTGPSFTPDDAYGAQFWEGGMDNVVTRFLRSMDALPLHWVNHFRHAIEIIGYKHPTPRIREWWHKLYLTMVNDLHLHPESLADMDRRLSDDREAWLERNNPATVD